MTNAARAGDLPNEAAPVAGELTTLSAVQPTEEQVEADRKNRISRSDAQLLSGATVVTVVCHLLRLRGIDLNPLPGQDDIPPEVGAAWGAIVGAGVARWMNRRS